MTTGGLCIGLAAVLATWHSTAQESGFRALRSQSGQFVVRGLPINASFLANAAPDSTSFVRLDPAVLAIGCDRIKQALLEELSLPDKWKGTIQLNLHPYRRDDESIQVTSVSFQNGWGYFVEMPEIVERTRLLRALVQALLSEIANRNVQERAAELPWWLIEGMTAHLRANNPSLLSLQLDTRIVRNHGREESLKTVRERLRNQSALTINELSWPPEDVDFPLFQACSQLFVHELLHLRGGSQCLGQMVLRAGNHLNWQTAFLEAFKPHFQRLIDVDKWWSLHVAHLTARDPMSVWPLRETLGQLRDILLTPVQTRSGPDQLPAASYIELAKVISEWEPARQDPVLQQKILQLQALRLRAAPEALPALDGYLIALQQYAFGKTGAAKAKMESAAASNPKATLLRRLKELDAARERLTRAR
jgi:hypothetical protein